MDGDNPYVEINAELNKEVLNYKLILNTIEYSNQEDSSIKFLLKAGDSLSLNNTNSEYYIKYVNNKQYVPFQLNQNQFVVYVIYLKVLLKIL